MRPNDLNTAPSPKPSRITYSCLYQVVGLYKAKATNNPVHDCLFSGSTATAMSDSKDVIVLSSDSEEDSGSQLSALKSLPSSQKKSVVKRLNLDVPRKQTRLDNFFMTFSIEKPPSSIQTRANKSNSQPTKRTTANTRWFDTRCALPTSIWWCYATAGKTAWNWKTIISIIHSWILGHMLLLIS